jgi:alpha-amylase
MKATQQSFQDYEEWLNKSKWTTLFGYTIISDRNNIILYTDNDEYIARRNGYGNPGLVVYINNSSSWIERWIPTNWANAQIKDFTGNSSWFPTTQGDNG